MTARTRHIPHEVPLSEATPWGLQTRVGCLGDTLETARLWQTGPQSPEHGLQFCPLFKNQDLTTVLPPLQKPRPDYSSAPSSEKPEGTTVPRTCSTVLPLLREARRQQWPHGATLQEQLWSNQDLKTTAFIQTAGLIN